MGKEPAGRGVGKAEEEKKRGEGEEADGLYAAEAGALALAAECLLALLLERDDAAVDHGRWSGNEGNPIAGMRGKPFPTTLIE